MMGKTYHVEAVHADDIYLRLTVDGQPYRILWAACSPRLAAASLLDRQDFRVSPSGYGISWLRLDEDLAIGPLLSQSEVDTAVERFDEGASSNASAHSRS